MNSLKYYLWIVTSGIAILFGLLCYSAVAAETDVDKFKIEEARLNVQLAEHTLRGQELIYKIAEHEYSHCVEKVTRLTKAHEGVAYNDVWEAKNQVIFAQIKLEQVQIDISKAKTQVDLAKLHLKKVSGVE